MSRRLERGAEVEVLDEGTRRWYKATLERRWNMAEMPSGRRFHLWDCIVTLEDGQTITARFDADHIRTQPPPPPKPKVNWWCRKHPKPCQGDTPDCEHWPT